VTLQQCESLRKRNCVKPVAVVPMPAVNSAESLLICYITYKVTKVAVFWVVVPCSLVLGNQRFEGRAASIFRIEVRNQGDVSTAFLPTQRSS